MSCEYNDQSKNKILSHEKLNHNLDQKKITWQIEVKNTKKDDFEFSDAGNRTPTFTALIR